jgi:hypothetical protein
MKILNLRQPYLLEESHQQFNINRTSRRPFKNTVTTYLKDLAAYDERVAQTEDNKIFSVPVTETFEN